MYRTGGNFEMSVNEIGDSENEVQDDLCLNCSARIDVSDPRGRPKEHSLFFKPKRKSCCLWTILAIILHLASINNLKISIFGQNF